MTGDFIGLGALEPRRLCAVAGTLDESFGIDGRFLHDIAGGMDRASVVAQQGDGKLLVAGYHNHPGQGFILRLHPDGSLDTSFADHGIYTSDRIDELRAIETNPATGAILLGGTNAFDVFEDQDVVFERLGADGSIDSAFHSAPYDLAGWMDDLADIALLPSGGFIAVGSGYLPIDNTPADASDWGILKFDAGGRLDTTFSGDGKLRINLGHGYTGNPYEDDSLTSVLVQNDGGILLGGSYTTYNDKQERQESWNIVRLGADGSIDKSFGNNGIATTRFAGRYPRSNDGWLNQMILQDDGKILALGTGYRNITIARYNSDGSLDTAFAESGIFAGDFEHGDRTNVSIHFNKDDGSIAFAAGGFVGGVLRGDGELVGTVVAADIAPEDSGTSYFRSTIVQADGKAVSVAMHAPADRNPHGTRPGWETYDLLVTRVHFLNATETIPAPNIPSDEPPIEEYMVGGVKSPYPMIVDDEIDITGGVDANPWSMRDYARHAANPSAAMPVRIIYFSQNDGDDEEDLVTSL